MRYYLGVAKDKGVTEGALREALSIAVAVSGGRVRAQAREALKGLMDPLQRGNQRGDVMGKPEFSEKDIKEAVKRRYAGAIERPASSCCGPAPSQPVQIGSSCCGPSMTEAMKGSMAKVAGYGEEELGRLPADAVQNSFGCGNPLAFAGVRPGQVVLDIGSGAGIDCLIAAEKVGPTGR